MQKRFGFLVLLFLFSTAICGQGHARDITISATEWPPFTSAELEDGGFMIDITRRAFEEMGYGVTVNIVPWKRALRGTKTGRYDVLVGASFTEERTEFFNYPQWYFPNDIALFTSEGGVQTYGELSDLCPAKVGVLSGSFLVDILSKTSCLEIETVDSTQAFMRLMRAGRLDMFVDNAVSIRHMIAKNNFTAIQINPPIRSDKVFAVISKKAPDAGQFLKDFDAGVEKLIKSGALRDILQRYDLSN